MAEMKTNLLLIPVAALLFPALGMTQGQVVINEYMSSNIDGLRDDDQEASDWIELYNPGASAIELTGWGISDDPNDSFQWVFPASAIGPGEFLVLHASGRDKRSFVNERTTVVGFGDDWRYLPGTAPPPAAWRESAFDDSSWALGPSGFGRGDGDDQTVLAEDTIYLRQTFVLSAQEIAELSTLNVHIDFDDGYIAYLNGEEIDRRNMGERFSNPPFDEGAAAQHEAQLYQQNWISGTRLDDLDQWLQPGENVLAIQVHNHPSGLDDLSLNPFLTFGRFTANPSNSVPPGLLFEDPILHANFKLASAGETITLTDRSGVLVDQVDTGLMYANLSRGRHPAGVPGQHYFFFATPGSANTDKAETSFSDPVNITPGPGYYATAVTVTMDHPQPGAVIRYTLDGSEPVLNSPKYNGPFSVPGPVGVIRARAFEAGRWPSFPATRTYVVGVRSEITVFSLVTDPPNLWDFNTGIYVKGPDALPFWPWLGANFYKAWERPVHMEMIEPDGSVPLQMDAGIMIHGGASRSFAQKSLRILARGGYGPEDMQSRMFIDRGSDSFKRIILRNGGTDWGNAILRDGLANTIAGDLDLETTHFRPAMVLLNGAYWGIQNLRNRQDKFYLEDKFGVDPDDLDILELNSDVVEGDRDHYDRMLQFIRDNPVSNPANYAHVQTLMDTDNFATYNAVEIFFANTDWPQNNIRYWRERTPEGRWRWILYDLDNGIGSNGSLTHNTLRMAMSGSGWQTFLFRSLMRNQEFAVGFINRYADLLNTTFLSSRTLPILQELGFGMNPEIDRHFARWSGNRIGWQNNLQDVGEFLGKRLAHARSHVEQEFQLAGQYRLDLGVEPIGAGSVSLTAIDVSDPFTGRYFLGVPVTVTAVPAEGYAFDSWSDPTLPNNEQVVIDPAADYALAARFVQTGPAAILHEVNYRSADDFDPRDWVEIHNNSDQILDLSGWQLQDEGNVFVVPQGASVAPRGFLVLCQDLNDFRALFPGVTNAIGDLGFGLSGSGERVSLLDASGQLRDQMEYRDQPPWPIPASGQGPTLELHQPGLDNANPRNWRASTAAHGTPGAGNSSRN